MRRRSTATSADSAATAFVTDAIGKTASRSPQDAMTESASATPKACGKEKPPKPCEEGAEGMPCAFEGAPYTAPCAGGSSAESEAGERRRAAEEDASGGRLTGSVCHARTDGRKAPDPHIVPGGYPKPATARP